mmetsp:Transcript_104091/g.333723  ORF Transcript_104091/g.333723 Transcript_104091/m.333723 type:complete len:263 (+) Transcript_104091:898-1686(+)
MMPLLLHHGLAQLHGTLRTSPDQRPIHRRLRSPEADGVRPVARDLHQRQAQGHHLVKHHAGAEHVRLGRDLAAPYLGSHRRRRAHRLVVAEVPGPEDLRHPKVDHHDVRDVLGAGRRHGLFVLTLHRRPRSSAGHEHDVGGLHVQVHDAVGVDVRDREEHLPRHVLDEGLLQGLGGPLGIPDLVLQLAAGTIVHDQVDVLSPVEILVEPRDVGVVHEAQVLHLGIQHLDEASDLGFADALHRPLRSGPALPNKLHLAEGTHA